MVCGSSGKGARFSNSGKLLDVGLSVWGLSFRIHRGACKEGTWGLGVTHGASEPLLEKIPTGIMQITPSE